MDKLDWRKLGDYEFTSDLSPDEWAWEFLRRCPEYRQEWQALRRSHTVFCGMILKDCRRKWGLRRGYLDPEINWTNVEFSPPGVGLFNPYLDRKSKKKLVLLTGESKVYYELDVRLPINPQIENIRKTLESCQRKCPIKTRKIVRFKHPATEWPKYLRLLDALSEGIPDKEIENILYSNPGQRFHDKKKQAQRLMRTDYRYIPFLKKSL